MRSIPLVLLVCGLSLAGCTSMPQSQPPMPQIIRPEACMGPCPTLPELTASDEGAVVVWLHDLIETAGTCRRLHDACRAAK